MIFEVPGSLFRARNGSQIRSESHLRRGSPRRGSSRTLKALLKALGAEKIKWESLRGRLETPVEAKNAPQGPPDLPWRLGVAAREPRFRLPA